MADALWLDEDYLMENSVIASNSDLKVITPNIIFAQDAYIKPLLGTTLFNIVQAEINTQTYTARITTLLQYHIYKVLLNYTLAESAHDFAYRWMNKGLMQKNSENSQPISAAQLKDIRERFKNRAEIFENRAKLYLIQYSTTYPEYYNGNTTLDEIQPNKNSFRTGIYLGDDDCGCDDYRKKNV